MKTRKRENQFKEVGTTVPAKKSKIVRMLANRFDNKEDKIRERAFIIYLNRGGNPGNEHEDWHMAEKEIGLSEEKILKL